MAINKLTGTAFSKIEAGDTEQLIADGGGLFVRVRAKADGGALSFRIAYRIENKQRWLTLKATTLADARMERDRHKELIRSGIDPALEAKLEKDRQRQAQLAEQAALARQQARISVRELFERWMITDLIRRKDGGKEIRRMFEKDVLPLLGDLAVEDVRKGHITSVPDALLARGVNRMARMIFSLVRQMFRFAVDRDIIESDPSATIRKAKIGSKEIERERVLSEDEIRELARKLPGANLLKTTECAIWIMLSTLCRVGELIKARWEHLDIEAGKWVIPAENSKNGKPHLVNLSDFAAQQFRYLVRLKESDQWVFPNRANTDHVCDKTISIQIKGRQTGKIHSNRSQANAALMLPGGNWTPHDLRRTGATMMTALGVLPEIAERCLNHTEENKMKRTYQRHSYDNEKRAAWRLLGDSLELTLNPADNIVTLKRTA
jgi:integrase